jgi:(hydroxyamino)benzene mutase
MPRRPGTAQTRSIAREARPQLKHAPAEGSTRAPASLLPNDCSTPPEQRYARGERRRGFLNPEDTQSIQRSLARAGALLLLLGLLTGFYISAAMGQRIAVDVHSAVASHLNALLGAFWMFAAAWSMPMMRYGLAGQRRLAIGIAVPNFANWAITAVKAALHVGGVDITQEPANNAVLAALTLFVVLPSLAAAVAWLAGFQKTRT